MKQCISYWSVEGGLAGTRPIKEAMKEAKDAGFDGIELAIATEGVLSTRTDQATCESYRKLADDMNLTCETVAAGLSWGCSPNRHQSGNAPQIDSASRRCAAARGMVRRQVDADGAGRRHHSVGPQVRPGAL